jgi:hypothetical protein
MVKIHVSAGSASIDKHHAPTDPRLTILGFGACKRPKALNVMIFHDCFL